MASRGLQAGDLILERLPSGTKQTSTINDIDCYVFESLINYVLIYYIAESHPNLIALLYM